MAIDHLKKQHSMMLAVLIFVFHFVFLAIYIYTYIYIARVIATQKKAATKATTSSLPTPLYQWMDGWMTPLCISSMKANSRHHISFTDKNLSQPAN